MSDGLPNKCTSCGGAWFGPSADCPNKRSAGCYSPQGARAYLAAATREYRAAKRCSDQFAAMVERVLATSVTVDAASPSEWDLVRELGERLGFARVIELCRSITRLRPDDETLALAEREGFRQVLQMCTILWAKREPQAAQEAVKLVRDALAATVPRRRRAPKTKRPGKAKVRTRR